MKLFRYFLAALLSLAPLGAAHGQFMLTGVGPGGIVPAGGSYDTDASTLFAAMSAQPDATRKTLINAYIVCEKGGAGSINGTNLWANWRVFDVFVAHDQQAARLNWKSPGTFDVTEVGAPTWATDQGYTGNGTAGTGASVGGVDKFLNLNFTASTDGGGIYTANAATISFLNYTNTSDSTWRDIGQFATGSGLGAVLNANGGSGLRGVINEAAGFTNYGGSDTRGIQSLVRTGLSAVNGYRNATFLVTASGSATGLPDQSLTALGDKSTSSRFSGRRLGGVWIGGTLNANGMADHYACSSAFYNGIGGAAAITP